MSTAARISGSTGAGKKGVSAMITVWGRRSSSNVQKVLWALTEANVAFERIAVGGQFGGTDTREFRKLNPMGLVPVIRDGTITMFESNAIVRHLARRYGRGSIAPRGRKAHALADQWMDWSASALNGPMTTIFMNKVRLPPERHDAPAVAAAERQVNGLMKILNRALGRKMWIGGKHFSYGDIPLGIFYWRYRNLDIKPVKLANLERWFEQLKARAAYREFVMVAIGGNLAEWTANEKALG